VNDEVYQLSIRRDGDDVPVNELLENPTHCIKVEADRTNGDVYINFESRLALLEFARKLLHVGKFEDGESIEWYPLAEQEGGTPMVVDGVRLTADSSRLFLFFPRRKTS
jgi:hypothetical protein